MRSIEVRRRSIVASNDEAGSAVPADDAVDDRAVRGLDGVVGDDVADGISIGRFDDREVARAERRLHGCPTDEDVARRAAEQGRAVEGDEDREADDDGPRDDRPDARAAGPPTVPDCGRS